MKRALTIVLFLHGLIAQGQIEVFEDRDTVEFRWVSPELMQKHNLNTCTYYDIINDSAVFSKKEIYNFIDTTYTTESYNKRGKLHSVTNPIYDQVNITVKHDTACCPIVNNEFDTYGRCIKSELYYENDMYKARDNFYNTYLDTTNYLKQEIKERTIHNKRVVSTETHQYEYVANYLGPLCRKTYYTLINSKGIYSFLKEEKCVNELGLINTVVIYNRDGSVKNRYRIDYE